MSWHGPITLPGGRVCTDRVQSHGHGNGCQTRARHEKIRRMTAWASTAIPGSAPAASPVPSSATAHVFDAGSALVPPDCATSMLMTASAGAVLMPCPNPRSGTLLKGWLLPMFVDSRPVALLQSFHPAFCPSCDPRVCLHPLSRNGFPGYAMQDLSMPSGIRDRSG